MTDRVRSLTVVLDRDVEGLITAISYMRFVASVKADVACSADYAARERVRSEAMGTLYDCLGRVLRGGKKADELKAFLEATK